VIATDDLLLCDFDTLRHPGDVLGATNERVNWSGTRLFSEQIDSAHKATD